MQGGGTVERMTTEDMRAALAVLRLLFGDVAVVGPGGGCCYTGGFRLYVYKPVRRCPGRARLVDEADRRMYGEKRRNAKSYLGNP